MEEYNYIKPKIVAEIGCNHKGDFDLAKKLILLAKNAGVEYVKFQKRNNKQLLTSSQYDAPHPNPENSYGKSYGEHREFLEFDLAQHENLKIFCEQNNLIYSTSVWDCSSAEEIATLCPEFIKVPSAKNNNFNMLEILRDNFNGQVQISTGMTTKDEIDEIVNFFKNTNSEDRLMLYACTSGYPVPPKDMCILEIKYLKDRYKKIVKEFGFSGHHLGTNIDIAAYTIGVQWIERHFTGDRTWKGTDHGASLEPAELKKLVDALNEVHLSLTYKQSDILDIEMVQRKKLKE